MGEFLPNGFSLKTLYFRNDPMILPIKSRLIKFMPMAVSIDTLQWANICPAFIFPHCHWWPGVNFSIRPKTADTSDWLNRLFMAEYEYYKNYSLRQCNFSPCLSPWWRYFIPPPSVLRIWLTVLVPLCTFFVHLFYRWGLVKGGVRLADFRHSQRWKWPSKNQ